MRGMPVRRLRSAAPCPMLRNGRRLRGELGCRGHPLHSQATPGGSHAPTGSLCSIPATPRPRVASRAAFRRSRPSQPLRQDTALARVTFAISQWQDPRTQIVVRRATPREPCLKLGDSSKTVRRKRFSPERSTGLQVCVSFRNRDPPGSTRTVDSDCFSSSSKKSAGPRSPNSCVRKFSCHSECRAAGSTTP